MQKRGPTHDTEFNVSPLVDGAFWLGTTTQDEPSHRSVNVPPPAPLFWMPTAMHMAELEQETLLSLLLPEALGACASAQPRPAPVPGTPR
jgi:hypothetical protein